MEKNNKKRLLKLIEILKKNSDETNHLKLDQIVSLLEKEGINVQNRKTLYDDFKTLNEMGFDIEYENGYYLLEAPFNLSEIKIIQDSICSLKNLDDKLLQDLNDKLYSFISLDEEKLLEKLKYSNKHKDRKLIHRMQDILLAIKNNKSVTIKKNNGNLEEVFPVFLHRSNDYYYFYYHYETSEKLYHYRFDNILDLTLNDKLDPINISRKTILDTIDASSNSFYKDKPELVSIIVNEDNEYLNQRFFDDFPNAIKTKDGFSIKVSINNVFFSKILAYGTQIKISDKNIANRYKKYLKEVINTYWPLNEETPVLFKASSSSLALTIW